jgi:hypothetical protein
MSDKSGRLKKRVGADIIIPVLGALYAVYYVASVWDFPPEAQRSGIFMASLLLFLVFVFFVRTAYELANGKAELDFSVILGPKDGRKNRLAFFGLILGYLLIVRWGGFTLTTFLFLFGGSLLAGLRPVKKALIFAGCASIGGWLFFIVLLKTRFPAGPFETLIKWLTASWN